MGGFLSTLTQSLDGKPRRPGLREQRRAGNAAASPLLRARRRHQLRRQRRRHARPGDPLQLSRSQPGRNPHGRRGQKRAGDVPARPHRRQPPLAHPARSPTLSCALSAGSLGVKDHAFTLPWTPAFLNKHGGLVLSIGQFNQWVGSQLMATGLVQIWPGTPVSRPALQRQQSRRPAPRRSGRGQIRRAHRRLHGRHGCARASSPSSATARSARSARLSTKSSACPKATRTASGRWA